jgi:hypothetical protein
MGASPHNVTKYALEGRCCYSRKSGLRGGRKPAAGKPHNALPQGRDVLTV